ncbi:MAG: EAL domain-containing protein [Deltaproteobacteria bacterium]|nr:EAL domain-containing protein [Deltaproteobacteria bacterium]
MTQVLSETWLARIFNIVDYAFQPIVNIHSGVCYGYEALLRNHEAAGFSSINELFDTAYNDQVLHAVDLYLREKAITKFTQLEWKNQVKLFFNLDNRVLSSADYKPGNTLNQLKFSNLTQDAFCFEISERHELSHNQAVSDVLNNYRSQGFKIAVDDCGAGFAGLKLLYYIRPDFVKIDRFFIQDITDDLNKRIFVASMVNLAHILGSVVIAEGVETKKEYYSCRNIGCDLIQGYLVQRPTVDIGQLQFRYDHIMALSEEEQRKDKSGDKNLIDMQMEYIDPVLSCSNVFDVFEKFKTRQHHTFFPVVNNNNEPLGIISDKSFKDYTFSRFGSQLLQNPSIGKSLNRFITRFPITDIHTPVEKILEIYTQNENIEGIIIVDNLKYKGFLNARSLLKVLNEKNLAIARDQNPLTKLPGNTLIHKYVSEAMLETGIPHYLVYFDFDNFKPYNDTYGFRQGDRVIMLFSEILKSRAQNLYGFAGHIGGDDFFMGVKDMELKKVYAKVQKLVKRFKNDVSSFYDSEAIEKGCIMARDREGRKVCFPLLTVSAVILELPAHRSTVYSVEEIGKKMADKKKSAKNSEEKVCVVRVTDTNELIMISNESLIGGSASTETSGNTILRPKIGEPGTSGQFVF